VSVLNEPNGVGVVELNGLDLLTLTPVPDRGGALDGRLQRWYGPPRRSHPCHAIPEPEGYGRTRKVTSKGANQVREDTGGPAGILKDTSRRRFGTVRPRVQIPGPRPVLQLDSDVRAIQCDIAAVAVYLKLGPL
jgi:hypothetical protein